MNKYEQLIEYIINDNEKAARELFHQIVVAKSRDIYESLMDEELGGNQAQGFVSDIQSGVEQDQQGLGEEDEEGEEFELGGDDDSIDGDDEAGDDFGGDDMGDDEFGGDDMGDEEGSVEDRVMDLEDELDALKAEFEQLLGGGDDMGGDDMGSDMDGDDAGDDFGGDDMDDMDDMDGAEEEPEMGMMEAAAGSGKSGSGKAGSGASGSGKAGSGASGSGKSGSGNPFAKKGSGSGKMESRSQAEIMKEYVDKVKDMYKGDASEGSEVGTGGSVTVNKTSITDNMKNDMGGTTANIAKGGAESDPKGTPPNKTGGVLKQGGEIDVAKRNVNKPGGNKGAQDWYGTKAKAKSAEGSTTDGSVPVAKDSIVQARK
jgi:hypothetical protein